MKIKKNLKYADFEYDEESKVFTIVDTEQGGVVELNKVYSFAFMRFVLRIAQRNWLRSSPKTKKGVEKPPDSVIHSETETADNPNQLSFPDIEDESPIITSTSSSVDTLLSS